MKEINIYIHIPYCKAKCRYCNFFVVAGRTPQLPTYFKALEKELLSYKEKLKNYSIKTIYFGGGTPSLVESKYISRLINAVKQNFTISENLDISIETNPENLTSEKLANYLSDGIRRISFGLQAWQNETLKYLGRLYTIEEFVEKFDLVKSSGFKNINIDLIFGIPNQTVEEWEESLDNVIALNPQHISTYSLEVDQESIFGIMEKQGKFKRLEEGIDREMYLLSREKLKEAGYKHYEISNFAKDGFQSKHNSAIWNGEEYIGLGASGHSYFDNERYNNVYSIEKYIAGILLNRDNRENVQPINKNQQTLEYIILQLRLIDGINLKAFAEKFGNDFSKLYKSQISNLEKKNLIYFENENLKLTSKGMDLENLVAMEFI